MEARGELQSAEAAYRRADARGLSGAICNLGVLLEQQGDLTGAIDAYRRAYDRGDANGAFNLAALLEEAGDSVGAMAAYRYACARGDNEMAGKALAALLVLDRSIRNRGSGQPASTGRTAGGDRARGDDLRAAGEGDRARMRIGASLSAAKEGAIAAKVVIAKTMSVPLGFAPRIGCPRPSG